MNPKIFKPSIKRMLGYIVYFLYHHNFNNLCGKRIKISGDKNINTKAFQAIADSGTTLILGISNIVYF